MKALYQLYASVSQPNPKLSKTQIVGLSMISAVGVKCTIKSILYMHTSLTLKIEAEVEGIGIIYTPAILGTHCS